jgi:hypothetical protein
MTMNKKTLMAIVLAPLITLGVVEAEAAYIETSASCSISGSDASSCDGSFQDNYSYNFVINDTSNTSIFHATLTNTSTESIAGALIDLLAFNMNPTLTLDTDFNIINVNPNWTFSQPDANSPIEFNYVGDANNPGDNRLSPGDMLTFDFQFLSLSLLPSDPFDLWLTSSDMSDGTGIGGGDDTGQVAVSFQQLGNIGDPCGPDDSNVSTIGECSDLLTSNWGPKNPPDEPPDEPIPEPSSILLMGLGLLGFGTSRIKAKKT